MEIEVHDILRVDGAIKASSLDKDTGVSMNGASGGSGGSILIRAGAYVGKYLCVLPMGSFYSKLMTNCSIE